MKEEIVYTRHSLARMAQRCGFGGRDQARKKAVKLVSRACERGISHKEASGPLRTYLDGLYLKHRSATQMLVFDRKVFLFKGKFLLTVLNLPTELIFSYEQCQRDKNQAIAAAEAKSA